MKTNEDENQNAAIYRFIHTIVWRLFCGNIPISHRLVHFANRPAIVEVQRKQFSCVMQYFGSVHT